MLEGDATDEARSMEAFLPAVEYRQKFEADLYDAADLPRKEWKVMPLRLEPKRNARGRKLWCLLCHLFIRDGSVIEEAMFNDDAIRSFDQWWEPGRRTCKDQVWDAIGCPDWFEGEGRRPWRAKLAGGVHVKRRGNGSIVVLSWK